MATINEDGTSIANFTAIHGAGLSTNGSALVNSGNGNYDGSQHNTAMDTGDHGASAIINGKDTNSYFDVKVRMNGLTGASRSGWHATVGGSNELYITEVTSGSGTDRVTGTATFANGDRFGVDAEGTTIRAEVNGSSVGSYSSSTYQSNTRVGWGLYRNAVVASFDDLLAADISSGVTITATPGAAIAAGTAASLVVARLIAAGPGAASAAGTQATVDRAVVVSAGPGASSAAGVDAAVDLAREIAATAGAAAAAGVAARIDQQLVVAATAGAAAAAGTDATIDAARVIAGGPGAAAAAGAAAQIIVSGAVVIVAGPAAAAAAGTSARVDLHRQIAATPGGATASGTAATLETGIVIQASPGAAAAAGGAAAVRLDRLISAGPGAAMAAGTPATLIDGGATEYTADSRARLGQATSQAPARRIGRSRAGVSESLRIGLSRQ